MAGQFIRSVLKFQCRQMPVWFEFSKREADVCQMDIVMGPGIPGLASTTGSCVDTTFSNSSSSLVNSYSSTRTGATVIATLLIDGSILGILVLLYRSGFCELQCEGLIPELVLPLGVYLVYAALGLVLLDAADKHSLTKAKFAFVGFWLLAVVDIVWTIVDLTVWHVRGHPSLLTLYFDPMSKLTMLITYAWILIAIRQLIEEIKAHSKPRAVGCGFSLQTAAICVGTTFVVTSIPLAGWLVLYLPGNILTAHVPARARTVPWIAPMSLLVAVALTYVVIGYKCIRSAQGLVRTTPISWKTVSGLVFFLLMALLAVVIVAGILLDKSWVQIAVDGAIIAFHAGALLIVSQLSHTGDS